jgi:hypothetical protein
LAAASFPRALDQALRPAQGWPAAGPRRDRGPRPKMAAANPLWGSPRIDGELCKLGIDVAERTVSRPIAKPRPPPSQTWRAFLTYHVQGLVSMTSSPCPPRAGGCSSSWSSSPPSAPGPPLQRHRAPHRCVDRPADCRHLPGRHRPRYLLRNRDTIFGDSFRRRVKGPRIQEVLTAASSPWQTPSRSASSARCGESASTMSSS